MGAETNIIFRDHFSAADRNAIQNRNVIFRAYKRITHASREIQTNVNSVRIISLTWENNFRREIQSSENRFIIIIGIDKDEQQSAILSRSNNQRDWEAFQTHICPGKQALALVSGVWAPFSRYSNGQLPGI
jgi:hypothetical protein